MRDSQVRQGFLALILSLPILIGLAADPASSSSPHSFSEVGQGVPSWMVLVVQVEALLIAGLWYAGTQRQRLLAELPLRDEP